MKAKNAALALAMTATVGCTPTRLSLLRRSAEGDLPPYQFGSGAKGQLIAAKRCEVRVAFLSRPLNDPVLNESVWRLADEQAIPDDLRRTLAANGLRIAVIPSTLPGEITEMLNAPAPHRVEPIVVSLPSGENNLLPLGAATSKLTLMLNLGGHVTGRDYTDAHGFLRLAASHEPSGGVALRLVPELQHGPVLHRFSPDDTTNPFAVQQFIVKDGQQEDSIRELAATVAVHPNQVVVVGCLPDRQRSLGHYLLTEPEANSDRLLQKVLLIWASQRQLDPVAIVQAPAAPSATPEARKDATAAKSPEGNAQAQRAR